MTANYHTHTPRCMHAEGAEEAYVQAALKGGFQVLGFADHSPYLFPNGYRSAIRMGPEQLQNYCETVTGLRKKYAGKLQIPLGVEMEFYPAFFADTLAFLRDHGVEYLLLGQHYLGDGMWESYVGRHTSDVQVLKHYCAQTMDAMQTGYFTYFAHPDLVRFTGDDRAYREQMRLVCREANSCGIPLEINLLGIQSGRHYPDRRFWELAAEEGCSVVFGCDAHAPQQLLDPLPEQAALALVRELGLRLLPAVPLRTF